MTAVVITGAITAVTYLPNNYRAGGLIYAPLLYYSQFMQGPFLNFTHWEIKRTIYAEHNNILRIVFLYIQAVIIFWFLNLGARMVIFLKIRELMRVSFWKNDHNFILFTAIFFSVVLGSFFIQTVSVFDTVQFFWLSLALLSIPSGLAAGTLWNLGGVKVKIILLFLFFSFSAAGYAQFILSHVAPSNPNIVPKAEAEAYDIVSTVVPKNEIIIYFPDKTAHSGTLMVSALTGRSVYLEPGGIPSRYDDEYSRRMKILNALDVSLKVCDKEEIQNSLTKIGSKNLLTMNSYPCLATSSAVMKHYSGENFQFFRFK